MFRTRVKICGITQPRNGADAARFGADAIGLVFYPPSPRAVELDAGAQIARALPPFVTVVGLFVNPEPEFVQQAMRAVGIGLLQFHGDESEVFCNSFDRPYIKAVPMGTNADVDDYSKRYPSASGLLLDSHGGDKQGGSGNSFDWARIPQNPARPIVLAGGLNPANVEAAVIQVRPWALDVSSGVESSKGLKDPDLMKHFIEGVRRGDSSGK